MAETMEWTERKTPAGEPRRMLSSRAEALLGLLRRGLVQYPDAGEITCSEAGLQRLAEELRDAGVEVKDALSPDGEGRAYWLQHRVADMEVRNG